MNVVQIQSLDDPRLLEYRDIRDRPRVLGEGQFLAEGRETVTTLLEHSPFRAKSVLLTEVAFDALREPLARVDGIDVFVATGDAMKQLTGIRFQQGCLALGEITRQHDAKGLLASLSNPAARVVVMEDVSNPDNVGSVFRNAFAFGADAVLLTAGCAHPLYRKTIRTSMGAVLRVPFSFGDPGGSAILSALGDAGYHRIALHPGERSEPLADLRAADGPVALIVGNEGAGLSPETRRDADREVRIEMHEAADSVNVATATGIALYALSIRARGPR